MENSYEEITIPVIGHNGVVEDYFLNKFNLGYYRGYSESEGEKRAVLKTAIYLKGSEKMIKVKLAPEQFRYMLNENKISLSGLDKDQADLILKLVDAYKKENKERYEKTKGSN
jgi:hypothetical protein